MCLYPKLIINPKYKPNKKNGGKPPFPLDKRTLYVPIECKNCMECMKGIANDWRVRLLEDIKKHKNGKFVTLTFSDESIEQLGKITNLSGYAKDNFIATIGVRRFLERWRKENKKSVRHWLITELGQTNSERIHLHGIIYTDLKGQIKKHWQYGHIWGDEEKTYVNAQTVNYITKYVTKQDILHKYYKPIILTSAGIGDNYINTYNAKLNKYKGKDTNTTYRTESGHKIAMPIYWRNKIYTENEREQLWLHQLDKNERWVNGIKVNANNHELYFATLKEARKLNSQLNYNNNKKDYKEQEYENKLRDLHKLKYNASPAGHKAKV